MARLIERKFNPAAPVLVRRFFVAAGRHWNPGDVFNWRQLAIAQRRVAQMFDAGKLMHADAPEGPVKLTPADIKITPAPTASQEMEDEDIHTLAAAAAAALNAANSAAETDEPQDDLTDMDMPALRAIAAQIGAPTRLRRSDQRAEIRKVRAAAEES